MRGFLIGLLIGLLFAIPGIADASHEPGQLSLHHQNKQNLVARSTTAGLTSLYVTPNGPITTGITSQFVVVDRDLESGTPNWTEMISTIGESEYLTGVQPVGNLTDNNLRGPWRFRYGSQQAFLEVTDTARRWEGGLSINKNIPGPSDALWLTNRHENAGGVSVGIGIGTGLDHSALEIQRSGQDTTMTLSAVRNGGSYPTLALDGAKSEAFLRGKLRLQPLSDLPLCDASGVGTLVVWTSALWFCNGSVWTQV